MDDRNLMENMLLLEKGVCDLFLHGAIEASTADVRQRFTDSLNTSLGIQNEIHSKMEAKGWCQADQADDSKISTVRMKYSSPSHC